MDESFRIAVQGCSRLPQKNRKGTCDSYVILTVTINGTKVKSSCTKTIKNTVFPKWDKATRLSFDRSCDSSAVVLTFDVRQRWLLWPDEQIGYHECSLAELKPQADGGRITFELVKGRDRHGKPTHDVLDHKGTKSTIYITCTRL